MKVGSIVECVNNKNPFDGSWEGCEIPKLKQPYTIRAIRDRPYHTDVLLEEIKNPICQATGDEWGYLIYRFRELLPPMEIQNALDSCEPVLIER